MIDIFSKEFLTNLKQQVKSKTKPSKALLEAIKDLTLANNNYKKKISEIQSQLTTLKQQNLILMQILQSTKNDMQNRIKIKDKKIENWIQIQAKLVAQNQSYKNQLQRLKQQMKLYKNTLKSSRMLTQSNIKAQKDRNLQKQKQIIEMGQNNSQYDLNAYLFSQKQKTQRQSIEDMTENNKNKDKYNDVVENQLGTERAVAKQSKKIRTKQNMHNMHKSQCDLSQISIKLQQKQ